MLKVGITGGIGSGKSIVTKVFAILGVPTYDADSRAKALVEENNSIISQIKQLLGEEAYTPHGKYNRAFVSEKVFNSKELLQKLNSIIHPAVGDDFENWTSKHKNEPYILKEAAIMGKNSGLDKIIVVQSPLDLRIKRIEARDGRTKEQIEGIIQNQKTEEEFLNLADYVIHNNEIDFITEQVLSIDTELKSF